MTADILPLIETRTAESQQDAAGIVADACQTATPIFPIGGATSLDFGLPAKAEGVGLSLNQLDKVVDFPARDLTITVEAGISMGRLSETLAEENLRLPIDVPQADAATIGGVIATNWNGPRRFGQGTVRDHVIGINAVDGRGKVFKGGGRVVKNVAGYDFCKLLTGSLGTLGVITQVTLRLKPVPRRTAFVLGQVGNVADAERYLAALIESEVCPVAVELLAGPAWNEDETTRTTLANAPSPDQACILAVGIEGDQSEVQWMTETLSHQWKQLGIPHFSTLLDDDAARLWRTLAEFPQAGESPLVLKANVVPSVVTDFIAAARQIDPKCDIQAHAGSGIVIVRMSVFPAEGLSRTLVQKLSPIAVKGHGSVVVLSNPGGAEMTHHSVWGGSSTQFQLMSEVKRQFDPRNILNPGRFVYV